MQGNFPSNLSDETLQTLDAKMPETTINNLCDDALREIFRYLSASELHVIAYVNREFNKNAKAELPSRYKVVNFDDDPTKYDPSKYQFYLRQLAPVLEKFGPSIVSIWVNIGVGDNSAESSHLMDLLIEYGGESLKILQLGGILFTSNMVSKLRPILSKLEVLKLRWCTWEQEPLAMEMLSYCSELHTIELEGVSQFIDRIPFPKLRSLSVSHEYNQPEANKSLERVLTSNPLLKEIDIRRNDNVNLRRIIQSIVAHTPQVEKIVLYGNGGDARNFVESAKQLKQLRALKSLNIGCNEKSFTPVLKELAAAHVPLECLLLTNFRSDAKFVNEISKWKQLKMLGLANAEYLSLADVFTIVRNLSEIIELSLYLDTVTKNELVEIVQSAPKLRKLEWGFYGNGIHLRDRTLDDEWFVQILNVLAKRKEKSPALLLSVVPYIRLNVSDDLRKANMDSIKIERNEDPCQGLFF